MSDPGPRCALNPGLPALPGSAIVLERRPRPTPAIEALARLIEHRLAPGDRAAQASAA